MTTWRDEVDRLRAEGLSGRQIAERVGMSRSTVGEHLAPRYCACGNVRALKGQQCRDCYDADRRWMRDRRLELVAGMYDDGWSHREMTAALGLVDTAGRGAPAGRYVHDARVAGLVGYRYTWCEAKVVA